jgi:hypothetical protein
MRELQKIQCLEQTGEGSREKIMPALGNRFPYRKDLGFGRG